MNSHRKSESSRMKQYKNRDNKVTPPNPMKIRRDEIVAKFRGIDLSDDGEGDNLSSNDDNAWSWDTLCNNEVKWDNKDETKDEIPWYVLSEDVSWDKFLEYSEYDRIRLGKSTQPSSPPQNDVMDDDGDDEETIDEKEIDPWATVKSEIIFEPLINISDPDTMLCAQCKQYSIRRIDRCKFSCSSCKYDHYFKPDTTILMIKHRMVESVNQHKAVCSANFSCYGLDHNANIVLICDKCRNKYHITKEFNPYSDQNYYP